MTFVMYATAVKKDYLQKLKEFAEEEVLRPYVEKVCTPTELSQVIENICQNHTSGKIVVKLEFDQ